MQKEEQIESNFKSSTYRNQNQRIKGLNGPSDKKQQVYLKIISTYFKPLSKPNQGEWLQEHPQKGQSFQQYSLGKHHKTEGIRKIIYILPLESKIPKQFLQNLKKYCQCFYFPLTVRLLQSQSKILSSVTSRMNDGVKQYHAGLILDKLKKQLPKDAFCMIGVSITDLYPRQSWNYVFGLASLQGRTGVFSFARHDNRFYSNEKYEVDYEKILWKSIGTLVHQIAHMFGLKHCVYYECLMNGSNDSQQASKKPLELCPICLKKLQYNIKFDIKQRYKKILQFMSNKIVSQNKKSLKSQNLVKAILSDIQSINIKDPQTIRKQNQSIDTIKNQKNNNLIRGKTVNKVKTKFL